MLASFLSCDCSLVEVLLADAVQQQLALDDVVCCNALDWDSVNQQCRVCYTLAVFQFHKGTIRTVGIRTEIPLILDFNSIKVRLEQFVQRFKCTQNLFQFHKGTIRTLMQLQYPLFSTYFNSIKVRLEQVVRIYVSELLKFQFHKGTIRTCYSIKNIFGST